MRLVTEKKQKRAKLINQVREKFNSKPEMSAEDLLEIERMDGEIEQLEKEIALLEKTEQREADLPEREERAVQPETERQNVVVRPQDTEQYRQAFNRFLRGEVNPEIRATLTLSGDGGYLVPTLIYQNVIDQLNQENVMRQLGTTTTTDSTTKIPVVSTQATATIVGEGVEATQGEPDLVQKTLGAFKFQGYIQLSEEMVQDTGFPVESMVRNWIVGAIARHEEQKFQTGGGTTEPEGVVAAVSTGKTLASNAAVTGDEILDLYFSVLPQYRRRGTWIMSDSLFKLIRKLKISAAGQAGEYQLLYEPGLRAGEGDLLLGKPLHISPYMDAMGANAKKPAIFGDLSFLLIGTRGGASFQVYPQLLGTNGLPNGLIGYRGYIRSDCVMTMTTAAKTLLTPGA